MQHPWSPDNPADGSASGLKEKAGACARTTNTPPHYWGCFPGTPEPSRDSSKRRSQIELLCIAKIALPDQTNTLAVQTLLGAKHTLASEIHVASTFEEGQGKTAVAQRPRSGIPFLWASGSGTLKIRAHNAQADLR